MYQRSIFDDQIIAATPLAYRIRPNIAWMSSQGRNILLEKDASFGK